MIPKERIKSTRVWDINSKLVVAYSIEEAIDIYQSYYNDAYHDIKNIRLVELTSTNTLALYDVNPS